MKVFGHQISKKIQDKSLRAMWEETIRSGGFTHQQLMVHLVVDHDVPGRDDIAWRASDRLLKKWKKDFKFVFNKEHKKWVFKTLTRKDEL